MEQRGEDSDSAEEIITVRQLLPISRLKEYQQHPSFSMKWPESNTNTSNSTRGPESSLPSDTERETIQFPPIISLNVGGHIYMTRRSTLMKYSDSMLAAMFSGRHHIDRDKDGNYFLDSNGTVFGHILEFLRYDNLPDKENSVLVYRDANYYGLHKLVEKLSLRPEIASLTVKEAQKAQFPNYCEAKELVIRTAIANASLSRIGEVNIYAFRKEFQAKAQNFNAKHNCVIDQAQVVVGPWEANVDEETFIRCLENDLIEDGYIIRPHESKRKCKYYNGQTCPKFIFKIGISFD